MTLELANEDPDCDRGESQHKHHRRPWDAGAFSSRCGTVMLMWPRLYQVRPPIDVELDHQYFWRYGNAAGLPVPEGSI